jgi:hypothetical protein
MARGYGLELATPPFYRYYYYIRRPLDLLRRYLPLVIAAVLGSRRHRAAIERKKEDLSLEAWFDSLQPERAVTPWEIPEADAAGGQTT